MASPNTTFDLSVEDLDLIEDALRNRKRALNEARFDGEVAEDDVEALLHEIHELLGRLHNQKTFYRPKTSVYVGG